MRIVKKINLALAGVVGISAILNFAALQLTVMPSFHELEHKTAERNQGRAIEAIELQKQIVANSARDWGFWDDTHEFMNGKRPDYVERNVDPDSLEALGVNFLVAIDPQGKVVLDKGYLFSDDDAEPIRLFGSDTVPVEHPFRQPFPRADARTGLLRTDHGIAVLGYAPILTSDKSGDAAGTLVFGKLLDIDALRAVTRVSFRMLPPDQAAPGTQGTQIAERPQVIEARTTLPGIDGLPLATLASTTEREISAAGRQAVWAAMGFLLLAGILLVSSLAFVLQRIAVRRIEAMRAHLVRIGVTGEIESIPADHKGDELSEMVGAFNDMAGQLIDLRRKLRRRDYDHGAADQAAGILHNVRNAVNPIGAIAWDLARAEEAGWKRNLADALGQLDDGATDPQRTDKLHQFVALSAGRLLKEGDARQEDLRGLSAMVRHVEEILKDQDAQSRTQRAIETIDVHATAEAAAELIRRRSGIAVVTDIPAGARILGHRVVLEQVWGNLLVNAVEAIEATGKSKGTVTVTASETLHNAVSAFDIQIRDDGDGIPAGQLEKIFERGFSTRRSRSSGLGLHWCSNVVNAMGGRIYAESEGAGRGARLHLVLPRAVQAIENAA